MKRVVRGLKNEAESQALATHGAMHHGQVSRSHSALQAFALGFLTDLGRRLGLLCIQ